MKSLLRLFVCLLTLVTSVSYAQKRTYTLADTPMAYDTTTGELTYSEVVQVDSAKAKQLFDRARLFMVKAFGSETSNQVTDEAGGVVACRGKLPLSTSVLRQALTGVYRPTEYEMTVEVQVKDSRYRYECSNIEIITGLQRIRFDDVTRKRPNLAKKQANRTFSQRDYDSYMGDSNPVMVFIRQLKSAMNPARNKNDF